MSLTIHKKDSEKTIRETIRKATERKNRKTVDLDRYFGKVDFGVDGLTYQKKIRDEWK
jgi:hypothetical protein